jgi:hypothetical protein
MAAPTGATGALYRVHVGPTGYAEDFTGYDALFFLNLTGEALVNPLLGIVESGTDSTFLEPLLAGGFATDPLFGGNGAADLGMLAGYGVYETLIPAGGTLFNFGADAAADRGQRLENGQFAFLTGAPTGPAAVPEPGTIALLLTGVAGLAGMRQLQRSGQRR